MVDISGRFRADPCRNYIAVSVNWGGVLLKGNTGLFQAGLELILIRTIWLCR